MSNHFFAELQRFRTWAIVAAVVHLIALSFASRLVDLAQQPRAVYQVLGMVYMAVGALLGLYQMGSYRRPAHWLNLLHRPLSRYRIAFGLCAAGVCVVLVALALPVALIAAYQEAMTARIVDLRHWLLPVASLLLATCGYLAGAYAVLAPWRYSSAVVVLPTLFLFAHAHGVMALAVQAVVLVYLAVLVAIVFKPDLDRAPRGLGPVVAVALPVQLGAYFLLWMLGIGYELAWTATGTHPLNSANPPSGGYIEASQAEPKDRLIAGIAISDDPQAELWREQAALSDVYALYPMRELPRSNSLTNTTRPAQFNDPERSILWVFSHDRTRFVGHGVLDRRAHGELGAGLNQDAFAGPALPSVDDTVFTSTVAYQYDREQQRLLPRVALPAGEVFASPPRVSGENLTAMSNRALYFYSGREAANTLEPLQPLLRVPLPGMIGQLASSEFVELLDGYLVSFTFINGVWSGEAEPYQQIVRVDGDGSVQNVAHRDLALDLPRAYTMRAWWLSPVLREVSLGARGLFAAPNLLDEATIPPPPRHLVILAMALCLMSLLGAIWLSGRQAHAPKARWTWVFVCGLVGLPALISLGLLFPVRTR